MKILVSAFKPFYKSINNYSSEVLEYITGVDKVILDVVYDECFKELSKKYNLDEYDYVISLGEARSRNVLTIEVEAHNIASCSIADNAGIIKKDEKIISDGLDVLNTKVNLDNIANYIELSHDAGKFVCNNIYYHLLHNYPTKSLFIHIPECNNDIKMYQEYAKVINKIILDLESVL